MFILVDCNNFYASCEQVFEARAHHRPLVVLSNNDGVIIARSEKAKQLGLLMGDPFFKVKEVCERHKVIVRSSNFTLYGDLSARIMSILRELNPDLEIYSIDEAFLKICSSLSLAERLEHSLKIRKTIKKWLGLTVSVGIGPTKTLAKVANDKAKKDCLGIFDLVEISVQEEVLSQLPVKRIWGIGRGLEKKLHLQQIYTAKQLRDADLYPIRKKMGVIAERIVLELRGISCLSLEGLKEENQSITCSRSFGRVLTTYEELSEALATYTAQAAVKLRQQHSFVSSLLVFIETLFEPTLRRRPRESLVMNLPYPIQDTPQLISWAKEGLKKIFVPSLAYKKCGVIFFNLSNDKDRQPDFLSPSLDPKKKILMTTIDRLNERYGKDTLCFAAMGLEGSWKGKRKGLSPCYTTRWEDLLIVNAN